MWKRLKIWWLQIRWRAKLRANQREKARLARRMRRRRRRKRVLKHLSPRRLADPRFYLRAVIVVAAAGLVGTIVIDGSITAFRPLSASDSTCRVLRFIDGDTVTLKCSGTGAFRTRLTGFDTPELFSPKCASEQLAAMKAKWMLRMMILEADDLNVTFSGIDRYGRRLAAVTLDGQPLADMMIGAGLARPYFGGRREGWCQ